MFAPDIKLSGVESPARRETHKQPTVNSSSFSRTRLVIGGNIVTAVAYGVFYGYAAGIFN